MELTGVYIDDSGVWADGSTPSIMQIQKLTIIQRLAMKGITGCYRTTPTAALEMETKLQPPWLRLQRKVLLIITRVWT